jgi:hypothetical protein
MIEIQFISLKNLAAILAGVFVALKNVVASEFYFLFRETIEKEQHDHAWHTNLPRDSRHHFVFRRGRREIAPTFEVVRQEIVGLIGRNNLSVAGVHESKGAPGRADVHCLPKAIEHQNLTI